MVLQAAGNRTGVRTRSHPLNRRRKCRHSAPSHRRPLFSKFSIFSSCWETGNTIRYSCDLSEHQWVTHRTRVTEHISLQTEGNHDLKNYRSQQALPVLKQNDCVDMDSSSSSSPESWIRSRFWSKSKYKSLISKKLNHFVNTDWRHAYFRKILLWIVMFHSHFTGCRNLIFTMYLNHLISCIECLFPSEVRSGCRCEVDTPKKIKLQILLCLRQFQRISD